MTESAPPTAPLPIALPLHQGPIRVRLGGIDEDLDALHEGDPLWWGKDWLVDRIRSMPADTPFLMLIGELDGEPVADAFLVGLGVAQNGYAMSGLYVLPRARRRGVGATIAKALTDATASFGLPGFATTVHEQDQGSLTAAGRLGFEVVGHHRESLLDLDTIDDATARECVASAEAAGFAMRALPHDADDTAWHEVFDLVNETSLDAPDSEGVTETLPFSVFRGFFPEPSYLLTAWREGELVGVTCVTDRPRDHAVNTFYTGVVRSARGVGLSTALKAQHALMLREGGHHRIYTQNMDQNAPILAANDRLGFVVVPGYYAVGRPV